MRRSTTLLLALLSTPMMAPAADSFELLGSHGFNWSKPKARCARITETDVKGFKRCEFKSTGAFGLPLAHHVCPRTQGGEVLAFRNADECQQALETMQANGP
jgi:hypothetical protein